MPATESTWRDLKLMHVVFGVSSLALLFSTLWMLVADHNRSWKEPQRKFRLADARFTDMLAIQQETAAFHEELVKRENALSAAKAAGVDDALVAEFKKIAGPLMEKLKISAGPKYLGEVDGATKKLTENTPPDTKEKIEAATSARAALFMSFGDVIKAIQFVENLKAREKKTTGSERDAKRSEYEIAIRDSLPDEVAQRRIAAFQEVEAKVNQLDREVQETKASRNRLEAIVKQANKPVEAAEASLNEQKAELDRLHKAADERHGTISRSLLEMPILDAFGGPLRPHQIWLPDLKIKFPLNQVARFDRCMTCHQGIDKTLPGLPTEAAFPQEDRVYISVTPQKPAALGKDDKALEPTFENVYGMKLADAGLLDDTAVTVVVFPQSEAAKAGMRTGDVIGRVNGTAAIDKETATRLLITAVEWGKPLVVEIRRGLPQPYSAHPQLDLFGTDASPHPFGKFGCTICHEGQGTATAFQHAEHTPNTVADEERWQRDFKWYSNHYWDWPQRPKRFVESSCLKCHHNVVELRQSEKFPVPPAPKLVHGYDLVRTYGCFGCHEIKGFAGPTERIGPDLRIEPDYYVWAILLKQQIEPKLAAARKEAAAAREAELKLGADGEKLTAEKTRLEGLKTAATEAKREAEVAQLDKQIADIDAQVTKSTEARIKAVAAQEPVNELEKTYQLAERVRTMPEDAVARAELTARIVADSVRATPASDVATKPAGDAAAVSTVAARPALLDAGAHKFADKFKDVESPGTLRKVGPSLRYVGAKVDGAFLSDWIANPANFRPTTRMPRVFGHFNHLEGKELETGKRFEAAELHGIVEYLLEKSQSFTYATPPAVEADAPAQIERGRQSFVTRGCLACHSLSDEGRKDATDPVAKALAKGHENQGPDLSKIGAKLSSGAKASGRDPRKWLYSWLKQPNRYHARTKMPNLILDPQAVVDAAGKPVVENVDGKEVAKTIDPAADIAAYLLSLGGWSPTAVAPVVAKDVDELALQHLAKAYRESEAKEILAKGLLRNPADVKSDDVELAIGVNPAKPISADELAHRKLLYVGRRAISKYGCFGCHDIPGYEDSKPIGTGLADWGRKETDKLAFERIGEYVGGGHEVGHSAAQAGGAHGDAHGASNAAEPVSTEEKRKADDHAYFHHQLLHGTRAGFAWQKLREPRSYDYKKTETKTYNEWLRMPKFSFPNGDDDIEAVMTFVLGLVADPPAPQYVYNPDPRRKAIVEGLQVLDKFNCQGCHVLETERLAVRFQPARPGSPGDFPTAPAYRRYDFLRQDTTPEQIAASLKPDYQGLAKGLLHVLPHLGRVNEEPRERLLDDEKSDYEPAPGEPVPDKIYRQYLIWKNAVVDGQTYYVGDQPIDVLDTTIDRTRTLAPWGGTAARLMIPLVYQLTKPVRGDLSGNGTWALVPPPLIGQGRKTQTAWLYDFLLDPHPIRPAVVLRMPKFNMSMDEARKIVAYFSAVDNVQFPYEFDPRTREEHLASVERSHPKRMEDALKVTVVVCKQCHMISDFKPAGPAAGMAPNLERIHKRIRPDYLRQWLASPVSILPYTNMPANFERQDVKNLQYFHGTTAEQLDAVVDVLLNYDQVMKNRAAVSKLVDEWAPPAAAAPPANGQPANGQPASGQPASGQPASGQPASGQPPATGKPATGTGDAAAGNADP